MNISELKTYSIFDKENGVKLPDGTNYYFKIKYENCDYLRYFRENPDKWVEDKKSEKFFFSNYEERSEIKSYSNPLVNYISNKQNLAKTIYREFYAPETVIFNLHKGRIPFELSKRWHPEQGSLWFLKKSGGITYGGYDVFPIRVLKKSSALRTIEALVKESNVYKKYRSDSFLLQRGIENPLLIPYKSDLYKFDIRAYGLFIKIDPKIPAEYYLFKKFLNRRSMAPYDPKKMTKEVMLTNTTQAGIVDFDIHELTSIGDDESPLYEDMFEVYSNLCSNYLRTLDKDTVDESPYINIIGLDFIFDESYNPYILEINRSPVIHCDPEKRERFHHNLEQDMFDDDFFEITFDAILNKEPVKFSTENYFYVE